MDGDSSASSMELITVSQTNDSVVNEVKFRTVVNVYFALLSDAYYHEMFLRGMPNLCAKMKRPTSKSTTTKDPVDASDPAPDFYAMSRLQPLPESGSTETQNNSSIGQRDYKLTPDGVGSAQRHLGSGNTSLEAKKAEIASPLNKLPAELS